MKKITSILLFAAASLTGQAQVGDSWIDVTDMYIVNPRFDNNDINTGWEGTPFGSASPRENAEHFSKSYDTHQTITGLAKGKYRLSLDAFYRMGEASYDYILYCGEWGDYNDYQHAKLYATSSKGSYETPIAPASSGAVEKSLGGGVSRVPSGWWIPEGQEANKYCIPNNMEAAYYWFEAGYYDNSVECEVGDDGTLTIGIRKDETIGSDWTCLDNWMLEFWGQVVHASSISLEEKEIRMAVSEKRSLRAIIKPENATYCGVTWTSSNESVVEIDNNGNMTATGEGECIITATSKDNTGLQATCTVKVTKNTPSAASIVINEIMASNIDFYLDPSQNYGSWVEIYNPTDLSVPLGGLYITDDPNNLKKHRLIDNYGAVSAHGYVLLNFDHHEVWTTNAYRQIDDKLDCDGGTIIISDGSKIIAQQDYPEAISRTSYARMTDGGDTWGITGTPTPGTSNNNGSFATTQLAAPVVDKDGQVFSAPMQVCVNIPAGATLRYTTDGTSPTMTNGETSATGLFKVDGSTVCYRFRLFQKDYLPSPVVTRTYIYEDKDYVFPIISIVTDEKNIYDTDRGVFKAGPYGRPGNGQTSKCNWNMDWNRPVSFEYISTDNEYILSQECNLAMCGGWSRAWTPHSFKLKAEKAYDFNKVFNAPLFDEKPYIKIKTLQIRNGGNDTSCRIKDPAIQQIIARSGMDVDHQAWQPVHVLINGAHYAVLNMREPNNKDYAYSNFGIDTDEMDQFEMSPDSGYVQMRGTDESFLRLVELSENASDQATYDEIQKLLDIDEYINYMASELYTGNWDWPQNNVKGFRDVNNGKFRFVLFDLDGALSTSTPFSTFFDKETYTFDTLHGFDYSLGQSVEGNHRREEIKFVTLFKNMLTNDTFRKKFIDTFCIMGGSVFQEKKVQAIVEEMANYLATGYYVWPQNTANNLKSSFNLTYAGNMANQLKSTKAMQISSTLRQKLVVASSLSNAFITLNGIKLPYSEFNGYVFSPVTLKAQAPVGYRFVGWTNAAGSVAETIFDAGSLWKYYDWDSLDDTNWTSSTFSDTWWNEGTAPIGYGKNQSTETTHNQTCYYFRKSFPLTSLPSSNDEFVLDFTIDDGAIIYVNGKEAGRYNMPSGTVNYSTVATTYAPNNPDTGSLTINGSMFKKGTNVIAVEVHNNSTSSTDILWDASLTKLAKITSAESIISTNEEYEMPSTGTHNLAAIFEPVTEEDMIAQGITPVRINEVSAANSIYVNDYFKKNDWIELYNTTDKDIDLAGMYISDNAEKPQKYQVPTGDVTLNTIIPANGYKVLWCDKLDNIGADIHTSFKLASEGGDVLISTDIYADTLSYAAHIGTQTFGRYPDGSNDTYVMNVPTIGKTNAICSYDTLYIASEQPVPDDIRSYTKEGTITIASVGNVINVKSEDAEIASVNVFSTSGMKMSTAVVTRQNRQFATVNVANLPKGIYIVSVNTTTGDESHTKIIIK